MQDLTSIRISKRTLRWIHRLKGLFERYTGSPMNLDTAIFLAVTLIDHQIASDIDETKKEYGEYLVEIERKMGPDKKWEYSLIEEYTALKELIGK